MEEINPSLILVAQYLMKYPRFASGGVCISIDENRVATVILPHEFHAASKAKSIWNFFIFTRLCVLNTFPVNPEII